jgi:hypothetical protein
MLIYKLIRSTLITSFIIAATMIIIDLPVVAQEVKEIGHFGDWKAYTRSDKNERFCYIVTKPKEASLRSKRGDIFLMIWHRPAKKEFDVVQVDAGYTFKKDKNGKQSSVIIQVGKDTWTLFTDRKNAWTNTSNDDAQIVKAMRKGMKLTVKGISSRNNPTTDKYSLKGVTAAYRAINKACKRS